MIRKTLLKIYKIINESYNYEKFVIIARSRTGSNLLRSFLNSHPQIEAQDELFGELKGKSCHEIWENIFVKKNKSIKYVGFKIFYYHPLNDSDNSVWDFIKKDKKIKIIHLKRENKLRAYLSRLIALQTQTWVDEGDKKKITLEDKRVKVNLEDCLKVFREVEFWEKETNNNFYNHPFYEITFEELTENSQKNMNDIFTFFNLKPHSISTNLKRQNSETIEKLVINYEELKTRLIKEGYSDF